MKRFFAFLGKLTAFLTFAGVVLYCVGYFFASKSRRLFDMICGIRHDISGDE